MGFADPSARRTSGPRPETPPWARAPLRVLRRAHRFARSGDEDDREDALIHADRAVEVAVATYVGLPDRVRRRQIPREQSQQARGSNFPEKLNFLEWYLEEIGHHDRELLEYAAHYHLLRNPAYHATTGFIPAVEDVDGALWTATEIFPAAVRI